MCPFVAVWGEDYPGFNLLSKQKKKRVKVAKIYLFCRPVPIKQALICVASLFLCQNLQAERLLTATLAKRLGQIDVRAAENSRLSKCYPKDHTDPIAYSLEYPVHIIPLLARLHKYSCSSSTSYVTQLLFL